MKKFLQLSIIFLIFLISLFFYLYYLKIDPTSEINKQNKMITQEEGNIDQSIESEKNNLIKNLKYNVKFDDNSEYNITADLSELSYKNEMEIVYMQKVTAIFIDENITQFMVSADNAIFNNSNYNTNFSDNIEIDYMSHKIFSDKLDLNFVENNVSIYENVVYQGLESTIKADNVDIDLVTKNTEIFMNNSEKSCGDLERKKLMATIKKFRIKSFKENKSILKLEKISLKFGRKIILDNLNLRLNSGQILGLLGQWSG